MLEKVSRPRGNVFFYWENTAFNSLQWMGWLSLSQEGRWLFYAYVTGSPLPGVMNNSFLLRERIKLSLRTIPATRYAPSDGRSTSPHKCELYPILSRFQNSSFYFNGKAGFMFTSKWTLWPVTCPCASQKTTCFCLKWIQSIKKPPWLNLLLFQLQYRRVHRSTGYVVLHCASSPD